MKFKTVFLFLTVFVFPFLSSAKLRTCGEIENIGCVDNNPAHIVIVLWGAEWGGVESLDYGKTWKTFGMDDIPKKLSPLPTFGQNRYMYVDKTVLLVSNDSGKHWSDIFPLNYLKQQIRKNVEEEKAKYMERLGNRIPRLRLDYWAVTYIISVLVFLAFLFMKNSPKNKTLITVSIVSIFTYGLIGLGLWYFGARFIEIMTWRQWDSRLVYWGGVWFPCWYLGGMLHLLVNPYFAPLLCVLYFPLTPMFVVTNKQIKNEFKQKVFLFTGGAVALLLFLFIIITAFTAYFWH